MSGDRVTFGRTEPEFGTLYGQKTFPGPSLQAILSGDCAEHA